MISNWVTRIEKTQKECQNFTKNALDESPSFVELRTLLILNIISNLVHWSDKCTLYEIIYITSACFVPFWHLIYKTECSTYLTVELFIVKSFQF